MKQEVELNEDLQELINKFYEKQTEIDEQQRELLSIAKQYYANKFPIYKKGNFYLSISKMGNVNVYYQQDALQLYRNNRTIYDDEKNEYVLIDKDNVIEGKFSLYKFFKEVNTTGVNYKSLRCEDMYSNYSVKHYLLFNEEDADDVFKKYGFKKPKITKQGIIALFNKMNDKGDLIPITMNQEEEKNNYSRELLIKYYNKEKAINKEQQELYFIAKKYYDIKFLNLQKGNIYVNKKWGDTKWEQFNIYYQPKKFSINRFSRTFYSDRESNEYKYGENIIEKNFGFDCPLYMVLTNGISDKYEKTFYKFNNDDNDTFLLFNESNANEIFNNYGFKTCKINKDFIKRLFIKIKEADDLTPLPITIF